MIAMQTKKSQTSGMIAHHAFFCGLLALVLLVGKGTDAINDCLANCSSDGSTVISFYGCALFDSDLEDVPACFEDFGKTNIEVLDIGPGNLITTLPEDMFDGLSSLKQLDIRANYRLTALPAGIFADLSSLESLTMYYNGFESLPDGIFDDLSSLTSLSATHNDLAVLPDGVFDRLRKLTSLDLSDNELVSLPTKPFSGLKSLQFLDLGDNALESVPVDAFAKMWRLQFLYLEDNMLTSLPHGLFSDLSLLSDLRLDGNADLQCLPNTTSSYVSLDSDDILNGTCVCEPVEAIGCGKSADCQPGTDGYICG